MEIAEKQRILDVLNSLEWIETNGGDEAYILVENSEKNRKQLNDVGVSDETINKYGDDETFCVLALAFSEGYADLYDGEEIVAFDNSVEIEISTGKCIYLYKHEGDFYLALSENSGSVSTKKLTGEQLETIKSVLA